MALVWSKNVHLYLWRWSSGKCESLGFLSSLANPQAGMLMGTYCSFHLIWSKHTNKLISGTWFKRVFSEPIVQKCYPSLPWQLWLAYRWGPPTWQHLSMLPEIQRMCCWHLDLFFFFLQQEFVSRCHLNGDANNLLCFSSFFTGSHYSQKVAEKRGKIYAVFPQSLSAVSSWWSQRYLLETPLETSS